MMSMYRKVSSVHAAIVMQEQRDRRSFRQVDWSTAEVDGVCSRDWPDMVDAYLTYLEWEDGTPLTDEELVEIQDEDPGMVQQLAREAVYG